MPPDAMPLTRSELVDGLAALGVAAGDTLMVHTRMSALGWVPGGEETVVRALLDVLGGDGTLVAYTAWDHHPETVDRMGAEAKAAYAADPPVFDRAVAGADRSFGRLPERIRTWPGARRSGDPGANVVAVGARAAWLTEPPGGYGAGGPFERLVASGAKVLMLGAPLETLTILHYAEAVAPIANKRTVTYEVPVVVGGGVETHVSTDIDSGAGAFPYEDLESDEDAFEVIGREALTAGVGVSGHIGAARCHLYPAADLVEFAVAWMLDRFGPVAFPGDGPPG